MSLSRLFSALVAIMLLTGCATAVAQPGAVAPSGQFGLSVGGSASFGGIGAQYAINPSIILGARLFLQNISSGGNSTTSYGINPYGRFLFEGPINPYIEVGLSTGKSPTTGISNSDLLVGGGLEYFASRNIGIYVGTTVFDLEFDPGSATAFGFFGVSVGAEWYFNK